MEYPEIKEEIRNITLELLEVVSVRDEQYTHQPTKEYIEIEIKSAITKLEKVIMQL